MSGGEVRWSHLPAIPSRRYSPPGLRADHAKGPERSCEPAMGILQKRQDLWQHRNDLGVVSRLTQRLNSVRTYAPPPPSTRRSAISHSIFNRARIPVRHTFAAPATSTSVLLVAASRAADGRLANGDQVTTGLLASRKIFTPQLPNQLAIAAASGSAAATHRGSNTRTRGKRSRPRPFPGVRMMVTSKAGSADKRAATSRPRKRSRLERRGAPSKSQIKSRRKYTIAAKVHYAAGNDKMTNKGVYNHN